MKYLILLLIIISTSCSRNASRCWDVYDALGNQLPQECGKTESEISAKYGNNYDRSDAPRYCWLIQNPGSPDPVYVENYSEKMIVIFSPGAQSRQKVACGYCQKWLSRQKNLHKPSGSFAYSQLQLKQYCGDTCATLYAGRIIVLRETTDSLITVEIMERH